MLQSSFAIGRVSGGGIMAPSNAWAWPDGLVSIKVSGRRVAVAIQYHLMVVASSALSSVIGCAKTPPPAA